MTEPTPLPAPPLAVTMGEPAGIGGDITLTAYARRSGAASGARRLPPFFVIDSPERLEALAARLGVPVAVREIAAPEEALAVFPDALPVLRQDVPAAVEPGQPDPANGPAVVAAIERAVTLTTEGRAGGVVTNPINKAVLKQAGFRHPGHTEFLGELAGGATPVMMLACPGLRVVPVTVHLSLREAVDSLRRETIVEIGRLTADGLRRNFAIARPRLAVAALNPHAGEGGVMGREEIDIIAPAVADLRALGIDAFGPAPADTLFHEAARTRYDAALCMTHDHALIPLKTIDFAGGVNVTLGLPFVRTSPDHGTAFDIAGTGAADDTSLCAALRMAGEMAALRRETPA
ncbi:4-hydroxythreonine-4-phosphate dehydrogenase [Caenispirillum salinarum AK4]|uniref:4-hydroxythreonine-4-phosphate dehydrogenase n=1 Tax=Caenispirillum salinarum AK4 TaxID=1238182 RepID=K9HNZ8_9PROT|nr:4-hydroxythreonine-4-phosphate dehydrogenase PdxA [Caenispirillum salinarum]EKV30176.1 4-hydroxythreonine-4-phosphate dehydrogenase [Caenispirillum salinarum AK4]